MKTFVNLGLSSLFGIVIGLVGYLIGGETVSYIIGVNANISFYLYCEIIDNIKRLKGELK
jgi:hypothetical protein